MILVNKVLFGKNQFGIILVNMKKEDYFNRIGFNNNGFEPNLENLKLLQRLHLLSVPFENLDIPWKNPIILDSDKFYQKIVNQKRGGFCYELNGLFYELLNKIGYKSKIISARVNNGKGDFGKEYDHLAILTKVDGEQYLSDVGFGDFIAEPLKFVLDLEQDDENGTYLIRKYDDEYFEVTKKVEDVWKSEYIFKDLERDLSEFEEMCKFHQTSKESHFTKGKVCSLMTKNGRKTLTDKKFIETVNGEKKEINVNSEKEFAQILENEFSIKN